MKSLALTLWFWLTHHYDCGWCKRRLHRAWIPLGPSRIGKALVPRVSHGICPKCLVKLKPTKAYENSNC